MDWLDKQDHITHFFDSAIAMAPLIGTGVVILILAIVLGRPLSRWLVKPISYATGSKLIELVVQRVIHLFIILIGLYLFLQLAGLTDAALAIISGTGLIGIILGFAFRDIAENFISSLLLSVQRPFRLGDVIEVSGQTGIVRQVTARATTLVDFDGNHIQIPNATIYKEVIKNFTANPKMRGSFTIGIGYDASIVEAQQIAFDVMSEHFAVLDDPEPQVLVDSLGSSTVNLVVYYWINSEEHSIWKVGSIMMRLIVNEFTAHNISMPDDARERVWVSAPSSPVPAEPESPDQPSPFAKPTIDIDEGLDDITNEADDIREQAEQARDPESGANIL